MPDPHAESPTGPTQPRRWHTAIVTAIILLLPLSYVLAVLIWLPYYFGLFFFLVGGLLVGGVAFRVARPARPVSRRRIITGVVIVTLTTGAATVSSEYHYFSRTIGESSDDRPRFMAARNDAIAHRQSPRVIDDEAAIAFRRAIGSEFAPGGPIGYARWSIAHQPLKVVVRTSREAITSPHAGSIWPLRTFVGWLLLGAGLWASFEALRSPTMVANVLGPDEEYEELED